MLTEARRGLRFTVVAMMLFGLGYPLVLWGLGRALFPARAEGSLLRRADGSVIGSRLLAQGFVRPQYFHPRPSAVDYDADAAGGSNYGPSNPEHLRLVRERLDAVTLQEGVAVASVPSEMVTASGGGLDPHIPPMAALLQAPRVARVRNLAIGRVLELVRAQIERPALGFLGRARVNVLELNLALDQVSSSKADAGPRR
jgi:K+-transporting ATPase ATPase C chain